MWTLYSVDNLDKTFFRQVVSINFINACTKFDRYCFNGLRNMTKPRFLDLESSFWNRQHVCSMSSYFLQEQSLMHFYFYKMNVNSQFLADQILFFWFLKRNNLPFVKLVKLTLVNEVSYIKSLQEIPSPKRIKNKLYFWRISSGVENRMENEACPTVVRHWTVLTNATYIS